MWRRRVVAAEEHEDDGLVTSRVRRVKALPRVLPLVGQF